MNNQSKTSFKITFIECRIGEPITAIDQNKGLLAFGSISGYFGLFDCTSNTLKFSEKCDIELIRAIKIVEEFLYVAVGDQEILVMRMKDFANTNRITFSSFIHNEHLCPNVFTFLSYNSSKNELHSLLCYFPTLDTEKLSYEMSSGLNKSPCFLKDMLAPKEKEKDFSKLFSRVNYTVPMDFQDDKLLYIC